MMLQMHDGAVVHTVRGPLRDGKQRGMAGVSKVWDAAGGQASGSKKGDSKKTTRNQDFFPSDIGRLYAGKQPQRAPAHMTNKQCLIDRAAADDSVESRMANHHHFPDTNMSGMAAHVMLDIETHELGKDDHVGLTVSQLKQLLRSQNMPDSGKKGKLVTALDDHIVAEGLGVSHPEKASPFKSGSAARKKLPSNRRKERSVPSALTVTADCMKPWFLLSQKSNLA